MLKEVRGPIHHIPDACALMYTQDSQLAYGRSQKKTKLIGII